MAGSVFGNDLSVAEHKGAVRAFFFRVAHQGFAGSVDFHAINIGVVDFVLAVAKLGSPLQRNTSTQIWKLSPDGEKRTSLKTYWENFIVTHAG